ncbi:MAG: ABC transporter ATP-binding protein [Herpetosiphon sp.]
MTSVYDLHAVVQRYGDRCVLSIGELHIEAGEFLAVVGPSGAGKSTLLRLLALIEAPDSGVVRFAGQAVPRGVVPTALRRQVTLVMPQPIMLDRTVQANLEYGLRVRGLKRPAAVEEMLGLLGLAALARNPAVSLSSGERQRLALGRALIYQPAVLLLDEPTANLDPSNVAALERLITAAHQRGTTTIMVTHNLPQARRLSERVLLLLDGRVAAVAPTGALFQCPPPGDAEAFLSGTMIY